MNYLNVRTTTKQKGENDEDFSSIRKPTKTMTIEDLFAVNCDSNCAVLLENKLNIVGALNGTGYSDI